MANPMFTNQNGNQGFIWTEWPVVPSDRADLIAFLNVDRYIEEYKRAGMLLDRKTLTERGKGTFKWQRISQAMVESLLFFHRLAYFRLVPDSDSPGTYFEMFISNEFRPRWQPGGMYDLSLNLRQYAP